MINETKFKVLMHCGLYVNANMLDQGIYTSTMPFIFSEDETIDTLIDRAGALKDMTGTKFLLDRYFDNLKQCELVPVIILQEQAMILDSGSTSSAVTVAGHWFDPSIGRDGR